MKQSSFLSSSIYRLASIRASNLNIFGRLFSLVVLFPKSYGNSSSVWRKCFLSVAMSLLLIQVGIILATPRVALPQCDSTQVHDVAFKLLQKDMLSRGLNTDGLVLSSFRQMNAYRASATCQFIVRLGGQEATMYATIEGSSEGSSEGSRQDKIFELSIHPAGGL